VIGFLLRVQHALDPVTQLAIVAAGVVEIRSAFPRVHQIPGSNEDGLCNRRRFAHGMKRFDMVPPLLTLFVSGTRQKISAGFHGFDSLEEPGFGAAPVA
jgi:hypothetical protein